ncbi:MAG: hypothetical protein KDM63_19115, partial [Verrucomicrobiae bacterium]|nr:hypothetical protein [Verrucomicrobiae bacterium]
MEAALQKPKPIGIWLFSLAFAVTTMGAFIALAKDLPRETYRSYTLSFSVLNRPYLVGCPGCGPAPVIDLTSSLTSCPVHQIQLSSAMISVGYGNRLREFPSELETEAFPFGLTSTEADCYYGFVSPQTAIVSQCPRCVDLRRAWFARHPFQIPDHPAGKQTDWISTIIENSPVPLPPPSLSTTPSPIDVTMDPEGTFPSLP